MANEKGNQYPLWYIDNNEQIFAVDSLGTLHQMSEAGFAYDLGISEDGTVWVLSTKADPDGGGLMVYWGDGDGNWKEFSTKDPGGMSISGGPADTCVILTADDEVYSYLTDETSLLLFKGQEIREITYGGGYFWAVLPNTLGGQSILQFMTSKDPLNQQWIPFTGNITPSGISSNNQGNCAAISNFSPMIYDKDGKTSSSAGKGADGQAVRISYRAWCFITNTNVNEYGNQIMELQEDGTFVSIGKRANKVEASYYVAS